MNAQRDGVWEVGGLKADFKFLYNHPNCPSIVRVRTVSGDHYAHESELTWDVERKYDRPRANR